MNKRTLKALKGSIEKWKKVRHERAKDNAASDCPLCDLFNTTIVGCNGCPVKQRTGKNWCQETPYQSFSRLRREDGSPYADTPQKKAQATREINFLKSLLPCTA